MLQELLDYFKKINGIDPTDTSQDDILLLYLGTALEVAKIKACNWDKWDNINDLPAPILLGIMEMIKLMQTRSGIVDSGVKSESIGGMSQTFFDVGLMTSDDYFKSAYDLFGMYCRAKNALNFRRAKRG